MKQYKESYRSLIPTSQYFYLFRNKGLAVLFCISHRKCDIHGDGKSPRGNPGNLPLPFFLSARVFSACTRALLGGACVRGGWDGIIQVD